MPICTQFNVEVADSFPLVAWEAFYNKGMKSTKANGDANWDFNRSMGCLVFRYKTCGESIDSMIGSWQAAGEEFGPPINYAMQRDLFIFFTCGMSAVESLFYSIYVVATQQSPTMLDWNNVNARRWKAKPGKIVETMGRVWPTGHAVITAVQDLTESAEWKSWNDFRNTMVHRSLPSRDLRVHSTHDWTQ